MKSKFKHHFDKEFLLIIHIRNFMCAHSIIHQSDNKRILIEALKEWLVLGGSTRTDANEVLHRNLEDKLVVYSPSIYKVAIRLSRILIFCHIGMGDDIDTSTHDWGVWGTFPENFRRKK